MPELVDGYLALTTKPMDGSVRPYGAMLNRVTRLVLDRLSHRFEDRVAVVGMQQRHVGVERAIERSGFQSEQCFESGIPRRLARRHVPTPRPKPARVERQRQMFRHARGTLFGQTLVGHIFGRADHRQHRAVFTEERRIYDEDAHGVAIAAQDGEVSPPRTPVVYNSGHDFVGLATMLHRDQYIRDRTTQHLVFRPAVQGLRGPVPQQDPTVGTRHDDCPGQHVQNGALAHA